MPSALARRYADAAFQVARDEKRIDAVGTDLARARALVRDPRVRTALSNPRVSVPERGRLVDGLLAGSSPTARNLVRLLVTRGRTQILDDVVTEYQAMSEAASGVLRAVVRSAVPLDAAAARQLEAALAARFHKPVRVEAVHDPTIIGGLLVRIGDRVIDASVRTHLQQLQAALA